MDRLKCTKKNVYEKKLIDAIITSIETHGGKECLSSIILTGSFGRGEPTYAFDKDGYLKLKSDVEIALVYPKAKEATEKLIRTVSLEFEEDLNLMAIDEKRVKKAYNFNYSLIIPKYKTIFTYDLFNGSKTIWGRDFIVKKLIGLEVCDLYEAKRLVANRIGELTYLQATSNEIQKEYLRKQWKGKLILAIASAWLICERSYVSSYHEQYDVIKNGHTRVDDVIGEGFFIEYQNVFQFLRENSVEYEVSDKQLCNYVKNINRVFKTKSINKPKVNSFSRILKYFIKYEKTGMKYGMFKFEDNILQALIDEYCEQRPEINETANIWHRVLY